MPHTWNLNAKRTFSEAFDANVAETEAAFRQRRDVMNKAWDNLDEHSQALEQRMLKVGIKPSVPGEKMLRLNVGGAPVNIRRSALEGRGHLGNLFESVWDQRLPRDADGLIVVDLSPTCVKHVIHTLLNSCDADLGTAKLASGDGLPADEKANLPYVIFVLGLAGRSYFEVTRRSYFEVTGGSTVLEGDELIRMSAIIRGWCPGQPSGLELVYRASRDGWAPEAFHARCGDDSPSTITLYRVTNAGPGTRDSVVGGFSSVPWTPGTQSSYRMSPGAFVFMLKDGTLPESASFQPVKWGIKEGCADQAVYSGVGFGPYFSGDLGTRTRHGPSLCAARWTYDIPAQASFVALNGRQVVDMETFRVCPAKATPPSRSPKLVPPAKLVPPPKLGLVDIQAFDPATLSTEGGRDDDIRSFGVFIADSLMEEKTALRQAHDELGEANAKAAASANALAAVYGPEVAEGKEDAVIELSVRGTRMTTLRSTLQACSDSALATKFDKEKWPATEKDVDERGRWVVDCSPSVFSKVLDVLRIRKRAAWAGGVAYGDGGLRVVVKAADRAAFEEFVGMYFPGCESFIMDYVANAAREASAAD